MVFGTGARTELEPDMIDPRYRNMKMNMVPEGGAQSAPVRPKGAFGGPPKRRGRGWDALKVLSGTLMDLDGSMGYGHRDAASQGLRDRNEQLRLRQEDEARKAKMAEALKGMGMPGMETLSTEQMSFIYGMQRDQVGDARDTRNFERGVVESDRTFDRGVMESDRGFDRGVMESDRTFDAGREDAQYGRAHNDRMFGLAETKANTEAAEAAGPDVSGESTLRKEFLSQNKPFQEVQRAYDRVKAVDTSNAAGQMGLIFQYMKMLDPGSTVREGEFATAQNTTGIPGAVLNAYNKARAGEFLNSDQVNDFRNQADNLYTAAADGFNRSFTDYRARSDSYGFDAGRTIPDLRGAGAPAKISGDDDYDALPSGAQYIGPDGILRTKP